MCATLTNQKLLEELTINPAENDKLLDLPVNSEETVKVYPRSVNRQQNTYLFIARSGINKYLFAFSTNGPDSILENLQGERVMNAGPDARAVIKRCPLNHHNARVVRTMFDFARPALIGLQNSIGLGDRLGLANPAHLRAIKGSRMKPILAQQSIRELERTNRTPEDVMDAATWAVLQEGYKDGFGADADHLKTTEDIDRMVQAGFTMFTFDPGSYVVNEADLMSVSELLERIKSVPWATLSDSFEKLVTRYQNRRFIVSSDFNIQPNKEQVLRAAVKYGGVVAHTCRLHEHLNERRKNDPFELELSVDETDSVTSPFEHLFIANELKRLGIKLVSLAPRFVGSLEKGVDYRGDLSQFLQEYVKHTKIAAAFGPYKLSLHSGSDKFSLYDAIASSGSGPIHIKTAGTSYLEALKTVADKSPVLFREILDFAREHFNTEKQSYHVSAKLQRVPSSAECSRKALTELFEQDDARQVLHVTFGRVLTAPNGQGSDLFRRRIMDCLQKNEETHYSYLEAHLHKHLKPFM